MLKAGLPLEGSLRQLAKGMAKGRFRDEVTALEQKLAQGQPLEQAVEESRLPDFYKRMLVAGRNSETLPQVLLLLGDYYQQAGVLATRVKGVLFYPGIVVVGSWLLSAPSTDASILVYADDGRRVATLDGPGMSRQVTPEHLETRLQDYLRRGPPEEAPARRRLFEGQPYTSHLPFHHQMLVDEWGQIWLQEYEPPTGPGRRWYVLSQSGELLAEVALPRPLIAFTIDAHGVLGYSYGAFEEQQVELLPFERRPLESASPLMECAA
jgi:hypothetical protein